MTTSLLTSALLFIACFSSFELAAKSVSFRTSMKRAPGFENSLFSQNPRWQTLQSLFRSYSKEHRRKSRLIPAYIHIVYLGGSLPYYVKRTVTSWQAAHPQWTVKVWMDPDLPTFQMKNKEAFDNAQSYSEKAAIWSYEILDLYGGVYVGNDIDCLRSVDRIHRKCAFYAGVSYDTTPVVSNALFGAKAGHPILQRCIESIAKDPTKTGSDLFSECVYATLTSSHHKVVVFPVTFFSPMPPGAKVPQETSMKAKKRWRRPESFAIRYWLP